MTEFLPKKGRGSYAAERLGPDSEGDWSMARGEQRRIGVVLGRPTADTPAPRGGSIVRREGPYFLGGVVCQA